VNGDGVISSNEHNVVTSTQTGYDELGRRISETTRTAAPNGSSTTSSAASGMSSTTRNRSPAIGYDELGQPAHPDDANNRTTSYGYDSLGRRTSRTLPLGQTESMIYNAVGNLSQRTDFNGTISGYTYDALNRLLTRTSNHPNAAARDVAFTYTVTGQRETMTDASG
jgi:YD repeat-containing protein